MGCHEPKASIRERPGEVRRLVDPGHYRRTASERNLLNCPAVRLVEWVIALFDKLRSLR